MALAVGCFAGCADSGSANRFPDFAFVHPDALAKEAPCQLASAGARPSVGDTLVMSDVPPAPCRLIAVPTHTLRPAPDGAYPDPGPGRVVRHPSGILTNVAWHMGRARAALLLWDSAGSFVRTVGGPGDGPGEFTTEYQLNAYEGPSGSLYVNEGRRWTVLDSTLSLVRTIVNPKIGFDDDALLVTGDGGYIYAGRAPGADPAMWFHSSDSAGNTESFGSVGRRDEQNVSGRSIAHASDSTFWAAPPLGAPDGYLLDEWTHDGRFVRVIKREVPWMHLPFSFLPGGPVMYPSLRVHTDEAGLLWVVVAVLRLGANPARLEIDASDDEGFEWARSNLEYRIEVLDVNTGIVVAAAHIPLREVDVGNPPPLLSWVPGRRESARVVTDDNDSAHIELFAWHVVQR